MHPTVFGFSVYYMGWLVALLVALVAGARLAAVHDLPRWRTLALVVVCAGALVVGSKLFYLVEVRFFPDDAILPFGWSHQWPWGFRILGGFLLLVAMAPLLTALFRLPYAHTWDALATLPLLAMVAVRLGCFLEGCCWGRVSSLPWAVRFPAGSSAHWYHASRGWIGEDAASSLPVHPLQLYLLGAAVLCVVVVRLWRPHRRFAGELQLVAVGLFAGTTALLEPLRAASLTLNQWVAPALALGAAATWTALRLRSSAAAPEARVAS